MQPTLHYRQFLTAVAALVLLISTVSAHAASAVARVSATVLPPVSSTQQLVVTSDAPLSASRSSGAITIANRAAHSQRVHLEFHDQSGNGSECQVRYAPRQTQLQPGQRQVVRFIKQGSNSVCEVNGELRVYSDASSLVASVPVQLAAN